MWPTDPRLFVGWYRLVGWTFLRLKADRVSHSVALAGCGQYPPRNKIAETGLALPSGVCGSDFQERMLLMPGNTRVYWLHCLTPTHVGTGRGIGYIDLPVYREKITNWPSVPGSAFKGVWADHFRATDTNRRANHQLRLAFGVADNGTSVGSNAGALIPTDARLVCLPVRSFAGTFAWCTSQLALHLLQRDLVLAGFQSLPSLPNPMPDGQVGLHPGSAVNDQGKVFLEDLDFS